jgi:hypothetical protein
MELNENKEKAVVKPLDSIDSLFSSRKILEIVKHAVKDYIADAVYVVARLATYAQIIYALKYFDFRLSQLNKYGIRVDTMKEVLPYEDRFEIRITVNLTSVDVKELKRNWRTIFNNLKKVDDETIKLIMRIGREPLTRTFVELSEEYVYEKVKDLQEFKVVKEEPITEENQAGDQS